MSRPADLRARRARLAALGGALLVLVLVAVLAARALGGGSRPPLLVPRPRLDYAHADPLRFRPSDEHSLEAAAAAGEAPILYALSPGGAVETARRVEQYRGLAEAATRGSGFDADLVEAIVFLESAGRADAIAGGRDVRSAAGLTQIVAETGTDLLGMHVDTARSQTLTNAIEAARARGDDAAVARLEARRRQADARFDPAQALAATVRYLSIARQRFGRDDLAVVSYHMGIGNLEGALRAYAGDQTTPIASLVRERDLSYARLYFDSTPLRHASAYARLAALSDDSRNYVWKVLAARDALRLYRHDPDALLKLAQQQAAAPAGQVVLHPEAEGADVPDDHALGRLWSHGSVQPLPVNGAPLGIRVDPQLGSGADVDPSRLRGLRPEALAMLLYLGAGVRAVSGVRAPLSVTGALTDVGTDAGTAGGAVERPAERVLHATGWAFDVRRRYASGRQAAAFQFLLDRLQAQHLIAWARYPSAIHVTVSPAASRLVPLLLRPAKR